MTFEKFNQKFSQAEEAASFYLDVMNEHGWRRPLVTLILPSLGMTGEAAEKAATLMINAGFEADPQCCADPNEVRTAAVRALWERAKIESAAQSLMLARKHRLEGQVGFALVEEKAAEHDLNQCTQTLDEESIDTMLAVWECSLDENPLETWGML